MQILKSAIEYSILNSCAHDTTRLLCENKYKIFGKIFGAYVVKHYFCTRIRERTAHQHDERGNLWKGDEVRDSKQDSNRRSDSKKTLNFSSEKFAG